MPEWSDVVALGTGLPETEESTWYGTPALKVAGKGFCRMRTDPDALVLRVTDMHEREALVQGQPGAFFKTPHYERYPYVLVRLAEVDPVELGELIEEAWRITAPPRLRRSEPGP